MRKAGSVGSLPRTYMIVFESPSLLRSSVRGLRRRYATRNDNWNLKGTDLPRAA